MTKPRTHRLRNTALGTGLVAGALTFYSRWAGRKAEAAVPADGRFLDVDGARLHYVDRGTGPAIVLVHGLGGQLRNFSYALLDLLTPHHRVILIDRPRSGYSTAAAGTEPGVVAQAAIIARAIEKLGLEKPLLVGHSLGGAISLALALDHPHTVRALALIAPLTQPLEKVPAAFRGLQARTKLTRTITARVLGVPLGQLTSPAVVKQVFAPEPVPADFGTRGGGALALRPGNIDAASFEISSANAEMTKIARRYHELKLPVSILFGREDHVLDHHLNGVVTTEHIKQATLDLIDGGHMLPVTQPARTAEFIRAA